MLVEMHSGSFNTSLGLLKSCIKHLLRTRGSLQNKVTQSSIRRYLRVINVLASICICLCYSDHMTHEWR